MIKLREATVDDLEILLEMEQGVVSAERPFDNTLKDKDVKYYDIVGLIESSKSSVVVATIEDLIVGSGYAKACLNKDYIKHREYAYLGFMYVLPEYRGKGINALIMQKLAEWSKSQNIYHLKLDVYYGNIAAIRAYEKMNFSKSMIEMRLDLS